MTLSADALAEADITTRSKYFGITYASSSPQSQVTVANGATVNAGRTLTVQSTAENNLTVMTLVPDLGDVANVSVSFGKGQARSNADIQAGANLQAQNATILAVNTNHILNVAMSAGFPGSQSVGVGSALVLGSYQSSANATVAGNVNVSGDLTVRAQSLNLDNESGASAKVQEPILPGAILDALKGFLAGIDLSVLVDGKTIDPNSGRPDAAVAAAVVLVESENTAAALIDDGAFVVVGGTLTVDSTAEEHFQTSAVGQASGADVVGIGGAVSWSRVSNQATAFIGNNANVDVTHAIHVTANATVTNPVTPFVPAVTLPAIGQGASTNQITQQYSDANAVAASVAAALQPVNAHLAPFAAAGTPYGTSFVDAGGDAPDGAATVAGGVGYLDIYNHGASGIAPGARVNQRGLAAAADQDVTLDATGTVQTTSLGGVDPGTLGGPTAAVGAFFNGLFLDNYADASVGDRAAVQAARDVTVHSLTTNDVLSVVQGGTVGSTAAVAGGFGLVVLGHESLAYIDDRARVNAGRDVRLTAENAGAVVNAVGGVVVGHDVGVGGSAAVTVDRQPGTLDDPASDGRSKTNAFIGDPAGAVGPGGTGGVTGQVTATHDVALDAHSTQQTFTVSASGASSAGALQDLGGAAEQYNGLEFGVGVSGDVAYNSLTYGVQAFIRDPALVSAGDAINVQATDTPVTSASAGAVAFGNHFGIGGAFANNGIDALTRAYTEYTRLNADDITTQATANDTLLTFSDGGAGTKASIAVAGSVNDTTANTLTEAALGAGTVAVAGNNIVIDAEGNLQSVSSAGASSASNVGFLAVGAALDLGTIQNGANAFVGSAADVTTPNDLHPNAATVENVLSVSAATADGGAGPQNRLYRNSGQPDPFAGVAGEDAGGRDTLTTAVALGDLNNDGHLDLVTGNFAQFNRSYLNDGTGAFGPGKEIGSFFGALGDLSVPSFTANALVPDLTLAIALADVNGDGYQDVIAGNLGQANRLYLNDGTGNFPTAGEDIGVGTLPVTIQPGDAANNVTAADLVTEVQQAVDTQLQAQGILPGTVTATDVNGRIQLTATGRILDAAAAEDALAAARRDGVLLTDPMTNMLSFPLTYDGTTITVTFDGGNPDDAALLVNATAQGLVANLQKRVDDTLVAAHAGNAGDIQVVLDGSGRIVFQLPAHTLDGAAQAESAIAGVQNGLTITAPVTVTLTYDGTAVHVMLAAGTSPDVPGLQNTVQAAVNAGLIAALGGGAAGAIQAHVDPTTRAISFTLHQLGDPSAVETQLAAARRAGRLVTDGGMPLVLQLNFSDADLTTSVAVGDLNGDGFPDLVVGNLSQHARVYLNAGTNVLAPGVQRFGVARDVSPDVGYTTAVALADLNGDGNLDLVVANIGFDLGALVQQGLVRVTDFLDNTIINLVDLAKSGLVSLTDLVEKGLTNAFGFDPLAPLTVQDLVDKGIAPFQDLIRVGLLKLQDFSNTPLNASDLTASGLVTQAQLIADNLINMAGQVSLQDLVNSGLVTLNQLARKNLITPGSLAVPTVTLGDLLGSQLTTIQNLIDAGLVDANNLLSQPIDLRKLIDSGIVSLADLVQKKLLSLADLDQQRLNLQNLADQYAFGGAMRIYFGDGSGSFSAGVDLSPDQFITRSLAIGDVNHDGHLDIVTGNTATGSRLYLNNGDGTFGPGTTISDIGPLTQAVALEDMNGDGNLDLVTGNLFTTNQIYLGDGTGNFGSGSSISSDADATRAIAIGDVDNDGHPDVVAGDSIPAIGAAGAVGAVTAGGFVKAYIDDGATVHTNRSVDVTADDRTNLTGIVGANASSGFGSIGLSLSTPNIQRNVSASIGSAVVDAALGSNLGAPQQVLVERDGHRHPAGVFLRFGHRGPGRPERLGHRQPDGQHGRRVHRPGRPSHGRQPRGQRRTGRARQRRANHHHPERRGQLRRGRPRRRRRRRGRRRARQVDPGPHRPRCQRDGAQPRLRPGEQRRLSERGRRGHRGGVRAGRGRVGGAAQHRRHDAGVDRWEGSGRRQRHRAGHHERDLPSRGGGGRVRPGRGHRRRRLNRRR